MEYNFDPLSIFKNLLTPASENKIERQPTDYKVETLGSLLNCVWLAPIVWILPRFQQTSTFGITVSAHYENLKVPPTPGFRGKIHNDLSINKLKDLGSIG